MPSRSKSSGGPYIVETPMADAIPRGVRFTPPDGDILEVGQCVVLFDQEYDFCQFEVVASENGVVTTGPAIPWPKREDAP